MMYESGSSIRGGKQLRKRCRWFFQLFTNPAQCCLHAEIESLIAQYGGHAASTVSKKTDYLVAGEKAGTKLDKAHTLGVPVISEADFENLIQPQT